MLGLVIGVYFGGVGKGLNGEFGAGFNSGWV